MIRSIRELSEKQVAGIVRDYPSAENRVLMERYGCSLRCLYNIANKYGVRKNKEVIAEISRRNRNRPDHPANRTTFKRGHTPFNKGRKIEEYTSSEAMERVKVSQFKPGNLPHNTKHDLCVTTRVDSKGNSYKWIRIGNAKWVAYHRWVWEQNFGAIPEGMNVQFKDRNPMNCVPENLYLIGRAEQMREENSFIAKYPKEVQDLIHLKGALKRQINKHKLNSDE